MIPKIIHQTAPADEKNWHPIWKECQQSWRDNFPDFEYIFWTDDDLKNLVQNNYPEFLELYDNFPHHIIRIDFARFCILHSYGGIYTDMDIFCYKNFYPTLENNLYIVESWEEWGEKVQNSLMISFKNHIFWEKCMQYCVEQHKNFTSSDFQNDCDNCILNICGPKFLSKILDSTVSILPKQFFNPKIENQFNWTGSKNYQNQYYINAYNDFIKLNSQNDDIITRHYLTGNWFI